MYKKLCSYDNLLFAFKRARKGKTKKRYIKRFESNLRENLLKLNNELSSRTYKPCLMKTFILRDPKTRKISKSAFRDRVVHHAICNLIVPLFEKSFIYDSHANQIGKGTHKALKRFDLFKRKVSKNNTKNCFVLKADIKHYFKNVDHKILLSILKRKISDERVLELIKKILENKALGEASFSSIEDLNKTYVKQEGMPLGNLTSQFFANVYLNELDQFVKHKLKVKYYIRYVDDFVLLHNSKRQLEIWEKEINKFLSSKLNLELHPDKSKIINLKKGIGFLGFRIFYNHRLLRKSNMKNFERKLNKMKFLFKQELINRKKIIDSFEGWLAYSSHANTFKYRKYIVRLINNFFNFKKMKK